MGRINSSKLLESLVGKDQFVDIGMDGSFGNVSYEKHCENVN
jgi:hypothetical protein